jgi:prepilin-type N-terminal cleavage/methylation domain-containing protein
MRTCKGRKGFSLIETLISLVILAIALLSLAAVPVVTTRALLLSDQRAKAAFFAASALDLGESANYGDPKNSNFGAYGVSNDPAVPNAFLLSSLDLTDTYTITLGFYTKGNSSPDWNPQPDYVQAEVSWSDVLGRSNPLKLSRDLGPSSHLVVSDDR